MNEQDPDLKGLQSFADQTDREESPIFVGRERETEHVVRQTEQVLRHAELLGEDHAQGAHTQGATIVITGCPGSGKSAFLGHFARTFAKLELTNTVLIPILHLSAQDRPEVPIASLRAWLTGPYARHVGWQPARGGTKHDAGTPGEH